MAKFTNTVDILGDDVVTDSIITKSITEYDDDTITSIGDYAFYKCSQLTKLILRSNTLCSLSSTQSLFSTPVAAISSEGYIYVPRTLVDSYKSATNWSNYSSKFRALEDYTVDGTTTGELDTTKI